MIETLIVDDFALIDHAEIEPDSGLTVISGETGSGKTLLLGALKLLMGLRADTSLIAPHAQQAKVQAQWSDGLICSRRISATSGSRCNVNGDLVNLSALAEVCEPLIELSGQHEQQVLLKSSRHLDLLEDFAGAELQPLLDSYQEAWQAYREASRRLAQTQALSQDLEAQQAQAAFVNRSISEVDPKPGEYEQLRQDLPKLAGGEGLAKGASGAYALLSGSDVASIDAAVETLQAAVGIDPAYDRLYQEALNIQEEFSALARALSEYAEGLTYDEELLNETQERVFAIEGLFRRFGPTYEELMKTWEEARQVLADSQDIDGKLAQQQSEVDRTGKELRKACAALETARKSAAEGFCSELAKGVQDLAMGTARFRFKVQELDFKDWSARGGCRYELLYQPASESAFLPFAKIASGGELSRILLAIKTIPSTSEAAKPTIIFDEIDAGLGGVTANAVAKRLRALSQGHQVIAVTHLPQIAAVADKQYVVSKQADAQNLQVRVQSVVGEERVHEIARMLSGSADELALAHARQLLGLTEA